MTEPVLGDAFGMAFLAHHAGGDGRHVIERDDGLVKSLEAGPYFSEPDEWPDVERALPARTEGPVLDVGAGAGRHSLAHVATEWFGLWWMPPGDLHAVASDAGWRLVEHGPGPVYWALLTTA